MANRPPDLARPISKGTQRRLEGSFYFFLVPLLILVWRLVQLQALADPSDGTLSGTKTTTARREILPAPRGPILASDGTALAVSLAEYKVCANPRAVADRPAMAKKLAEIIGGDADKYLAVLSKTTRANGGKIQYAVLAKRVDGALVAELRRLKFGKIKSEKRAARAARRKLWEPITWEATPRRHYPLGQFACQFIGFTTGSGKGVDGLERAADKQLAGTPGEILAQLDAQGRPVPGFVEEWRQPVAGLTVVTTIDPQIQADTDAVMAKLAKKFTPKLATAIVMRARTGEVVAMSTIPGYDLNHRPKNVVDLATNQCTGYAYEPGSTFKMITACAAVEKVADWRNHSFYCNGVQQVGKHSMHCWVNSTAKRRHGQEDLSTSIRDSCNFGVYGFARLAGADKMLEYSKNFGLGQRIDLAGLAQHPGLLPGNSPREWSAEQLANFSFGQGMLITPLQLVRVAATIANDGVMMKPLLIKELRNENGEVVKSFPPVAERRVIQASTARTVTKMMERVTTEGTASKFIFVPGYVTAGKTGSAQKADGPRGYAAGKFISSFVGFLPSQKPEYVILIMADEPHGSHWGSEVCGPAYQDIASAAMLHLRLREGTAAPQPVAALMHRKEKKPAIN